MHEIGACAHARAAGSTGRTHCMAEVQWWRPYPSETGGPMQVSSKRKVTFAGEPREIVTTSMFQGEERKIDAAFISGEGWHARVVFTDCGHVEEDQLLATVVLPGDR